MLRNFSVSFIGGLRGNTIFSSSFASMRTTVDYIFNDTIILAKDFPSLVENSLTTINTGMQNSIYKGAVYTKGDSLLESVGAYGIKSGTANDTVAALKNSIIYISNINNNSKSLDTDVNSIIQTSAQIQNSMCTNMQKKF